MIRGGLLLVAVAACGPPPALDRQWRDEIIYQIVVDRFANGDPTNDAFVDPDDLARHQGGDWRGITENLDYVEATGATAIWISPVVDNVPRRGRWDGYHGYWASDFDRPNPRFGTMEELQTLVKEAHVRDLRVIVDVVANHAGNVFFYDLDEDGELDPGEDEPPFSEDGPYEAPIVWRDAPPTLGGVTLGPEHFHRRGSPRRYVGEERELGDFPTGLRDLDTENPEVLTLLADAYAGWVEQTGVDGFRLDAVPHAPRAFWADFGARLRERLAALGKEDFLLVGEVFDPDPATLASYAESGLDAVFDFSLKADVIDAVLLDGAPAARAVDVLTTYRSLYTEPAWQRRIAFADNHDLPRLRGFVDDPRITVLAMTLIFTLDAIPCVYYGTEQGLTGDGGHRSREPLFRHGFDRDAFELRVIGRLAELRRRVPALRRGALIIRHASTADGRSRNEDAGLLVYERVLADQRILVAINAHAAKESSARFSTGFSPNTELAELLFTGDRRYRTDDDGRLALRLPPRSAVLLTAAGDVGSKM